MLQSKYLWSCSYKNSIEEHLPTLRDLARECSSVVEIGVNAASSTWGLMMGLVENEKSVKKYTGIDIYVKDWNVIMEAEKIAKLSGIQFNFLKIDDMMVDLTCEYDLLFIDSMHTYCHLTYELEKFNFNARKYIVLHDTSAPWGDADDGDYRGDYSEYPEWYDRTKRGCWPAAEDFLARHPEWALVERKTNCHGLTIMKRL